MHDGVPGIHAVPQPGGPARRARDRVVKSVLFVVFVLGVAYVAWPFYALVQFDRAVVHNEALELEELLDLQSVRTALKRDFEARGGQSQNPVLRWIRGGMEQINAQTVEHVVDVHWIRERVLEAMNRDRSDGVIPGVSFAFFDRPERFLVRYGELGESPVHLYFTLDRGVWRWRVTAIFP